MVVLGPPETAFHAKGPLRAHRPLHARFCNRRELPATYRGGGFKLHCNTTTKSCLQWGLSSCVEHNGRIH